MGTADEEVLCLRSYGAGTAKSERIEELASQVRLSNTQYESIRV